MLLELAGIQAVALPVVDAAAKVARGHVARAPEVAGAGGERRRVELRGRVLLPHLGLGRGIVLEIGPLDPAQQPAARAVLAAGHPRDGFPSRVVDELDQDHAAQLPPATLSAYGVLP